MERLAAVALHHVYIVKSLVREKFDGSCRQRRLNFARDNSTTVLGEGLGGDAYRSYKQLYERILLPYDCLYVYKFTVEGACFHTVLHLHSVCVAHMCMFMVRISR